MSPQDAVDLARDALWTGLLISSPVLVTGMVVGLVVGLLQALTQVQEQTIAFVPKVVIMVLIFSLTLPWFLTRFLQYSGDLIGSIATRL